MTLTRLYRISYLNQGKINEVIVAATSMSKALERCGEHDAMPNHHPIKCELILEYRDVYIGE